MRNKKSSINFTDAVKSPKTSAHQVNIEMRGSKGFKSPKATANAMKKKETLRILGDSSRHLDHSFRRVNEDLKDFNLGKCVSNHSLQTFNNIDIIENSPNPLNDRVKTEADKMKDSNMIPIGTNELDNASVSNSIISLLPEDVK
jgi:hypothetical protein